MATRWTATGSSNSSSAVECCWRRASSIERRSRSGGRWSCGVEPRSRSSSRGRRGRSRRPGSRSCVVSAEESLLEARLHLGEHRDVVADRRGAGGRGAVARASLGDARARAVSLWSPGRRAAGAEAGAAHARRAAGDRAGPELVALEAAILRQDESLLAPPPPPAIAEHCPYKGLAPYDVDDTDTFFGRDDEVASCLERLRGEPAAGGHRAVRVRQVVAGAGRPGPGAAAGGAHGRGVLAGR